jgi:hypothetical protein
MTSDSMMQTNIVVGRWTWKGKRNVVEADVGAYHIINPVDKYHIRIRRRTLRDGKYRIIVPQRYLRVHLLAGIHVAHDGPNRSPSTISCNNLVLALQVLRLL